MQGAGTSCFIAVMVVAIGCSAGILIGSVCGYYGGTADLILMRVCDTITAFPAILLCSISLLCFTATNGADRKLKFASR